MTLPTTHRHTVRGLDLAFHTWGDPSRPMIICVHGFLDCGKSWGDVASHLCDRYYVVAPDMRGFGESGWVGDGGYYHFYDYYTDMMALLDHLGAETVALVGHSMGGSIVSGLASLIGPQCRSAVLIEGLGPPASDPAHTVGRLRLWAAAMSRATVQGPSSERRKHRRVMPDLSAAAFRLRKYNSRLGVARSMTLAVALTEPTEALDGVVFRHDPLHMTPAAKPYWMQEAHAMWRSIACPVLLLSGAESSMPTEDLEGRFSHLPTARSFLVPAAGHNVHHDRPELVAGAIDAWVSDTHESLPDELSEGFPTPGRPAVR